MQMLMPLLTVSTILVMELAVTLVHKYIMHGFGWGWHESHHTPHKHGAFEKNDLYAVIFAVATIMLFVWGDRTVWLWWMALGITIYGILYAFVHDVLVHKRLPVKWRPDNKYVRRLIDAHHMHHVVRDREGAVSFGFLYAPKLDKLRNQLRGRKNP